MKTTELKYAVRLMCVILALAWMATFTFAQTTTSGAIAGTVNDKSGAAVPNAKITVTNAGTNDKTDTTSNSVGEYRVSNLTPGVYMVAVSAQGFGAYKASVSVEVGRVVTFDPKLTVGAKGETVEVTAQTQAVNTESQELSSNFDQTAINTLPINGRRWSNYALLSPTANPDGTFGLMSFRGISGLLNNFTVDGGDNNSNFYAEERGRTRLSYSTSQDAIQEFQINTSNYSAQYGRSAGGAVNAVTKSGTNKYHGTGYWYDRNNAMGATNPSTFLFGKPYKPVDVRYQYGATAGGPIVKDKAFFFFNWDQQARNFPGLTVPLTGTNGCTSTGVCAPIAVSAPASCPANSTTLTGLTIGQGFYCRYGSNLALAQQAANDSVAFINSFLTTVPRRGDQLIFLPKVDIKMFGGNLSGSFNYLNWTSPAGIQTQPSNTIASDEFGNDLVKTRTFNLSYAKALNTSTSMELKYHWSNELLLGTFQPNLPGQPSVAGPTGSHPPGVFVASWLNFGTQSYLPRDQNPEETQNQGSIHFTKSMGRHTLKTGFEVLNNAEIVSSLSNAYGNYSYTGALSILNFASDAYNTTTRAFTGSGASQCSGTACYSTFSQGIGTLKYAFSSRDYAAYFQDDFRVKPRLTLNLGVRYEYEQFPTAQFANPALPATSNRPSDKNNFGPRIGFSWDVLGNGKLAVRGGYGLYYARIINSTMASVLTSTGVLTAQPSFTVTPTTLVNGAPLAYPNIIASSGGLTAPVFDVVFYDPKLSNPYIHQGDIIMEYEVAKDTVFSFSYLVSKGRKLVSFLDTNLPAYGATNATFNMPDGTSAAVQTYGNIARPNTAFNRITDVGNQIYSDYYAYVAQLNKRMSHGLQFSTNYTYSKAKDNGQSSSTFTASNNAYDPNNLALEYGVSNFDFTHKFVATAIWQPMFFKNKEKGWHYLMDGWTLSPIEYFSAGAPYTGFISGSVPSTCPFVLLASAPVGTPAPCTATAPSPLPVANVANCASTHSTGLNCAQGNSRVPSVVRNGFRMPNRNSVDFRVGRSVGFGPNEKYVVEFNAESFNLFNHSNVTSVGTTQFNMGTCNGNNVPGTNAPANYASTGPLVCSLTANAAFGIPTSINGGTNLRERQIQFSLRFKF